MASIPTVSWDETSPAGSQTIKLGDDRIREFKTQVREVIGVDHDFPSSGQATDNGQHLRVTLQEQSDLGSGAVGTTILGNQTVSGKGELVYSDEDNNDVQLTSSGALALSYAATKAALINIIYPIGCIYTTTVSTNPNTLFGTGTWAAFGAGKVLIGIDSGDTDFDTVEETGGAKTVAHTHTGTTGYTNNWYDPNVNDITKYPNQWDTNQELDHKHDFTTGSTSPSVVQPYIVVYFWQRTA